MDIKHHFLTTKTQSTFQLVGIAREQSSIGNCRHPDWRERLTRSIVTKVQTNRLDTTSERERSFDEGKPFAPFSLKD